MKKLIAILLTLVILLMIPCSTLASGACNNSTVLATATQNDNSTDTRVGVIKSFCVSATKCRSQIRNYSEVKLISFINQYGKHKIIIVKVVSQSAGFVSYVLRSVGVIQSSMGYNQLKTMTSAISDPKNGALAFSGSTVGFYFDGRVYYANTKGMSCVAYGRNWTLGWMKGL